MNLPNLSGHYVAGTGIVVYLHFLHHHKSTKPIFFGMLYDCLLHSLTHQDALGAREDYMYQPAIAIRLVPGPTPPLWSRRSLLSRILAYGECLSWSCHACSDILRLEHIRLVHYYYIQQWREFYPYWTNSHIFLACHWEGSYNCTRLLPTTILFQSSIIRSSMNFLS